MLYFLSRTLSSRGLSISFVRPLNIAPLSKSIQSDSHLKCLVCAVTNTCFIEHRRFIFPNSLYNRAGIGFNLPGQGLKKKMSKEDEDNNLVLNFINKKMQEQEEGKERFPILPDYKFFWKVFAYGVFTVFFGFLVYPDLKALVFKEYDVAIDTKAYDSIKPESILAYIYLSLPLRFFSRLFGRFMNLKLNSLTRSFVLNGFCFLTGANVNEALVTDFNQYKSLGAFFRRPIKSELRPIDPSSDVVSPSDGRILIYGSVNDGKVEQVKGVTYSLQSFLGPLKSETVEILEFTKISEKIFQKSLMRDPVNNNLYQCVVYLAPKDYHGFHSPVDWTIKRRRHFPGELLSVNPRIASWIKNLFVLNERVVLSGEWKYGFFSMSAVGATNVGSIKIYGDALLHTNQIKFKSGTYHDLNFYNEEIKIKKGDPVGEFNLGSTIVLLFEAPKNFSFDLQKDQKVKYGESLEKMSL